MTARTHDLIAFGSLLTIASYYPPSSLNVSTLITCLVGNIVGALLPDTDQSTNRLWDLLPVGNTLGRLFRKLMLNHRTISHSLLGIYIIYKITSIVVPKIFNPVNINTDLVILSIMVGFVSHIAADSLTKEGIPLFFPIKFKIGIPPIELFRMTTGKLMEKFIIFPAVVTYILWLAYFKKDIFLDLVKLIRN
jgi:inner membrane protein